ncbi:TetR/AcrR family transcriptional regulator [Bradyrhizobium diazoefficiens]|nr:TetR/AcrR family transcriptional regulator [Bradyrhizobium diazoefficiens]
MSSPRQNTKPGLRKAPTQVRSKERVARILGAAGAVLADHGYAGLTVKAVATEASVPIGTIYQFFATKEDIVAALSQQFAQEIRALAQERLNASTLRTDPASFVAVLVDGMAELQQRSSGFVCVYAGSQSDSAFEALAADLRQVLGARLDTLFADAFPKLAASERRRILSVWSDITRAMIGGLDRSRPGERDALLRELKIVLSSYLKAKL